MWLHHNSFPLLGQLDVIPLSLPSTVLQRSTLCINLCLTLVVSSEQNSRTEFVGQKMIPFEVLNTIAPPAKCLNPAPSPGRIPTFPHPQWSCVLVAPLCPTLCDPMDCSPPGSSVHGILQARMLGWVAISSPAVLGLHVKNLC